MWQSWLSSWLSKELQCNPQYKKLLEVTNTVCISLRNWQSNKVTNTSINNPQIESEMQELVQLVLQNSPNSLHSNIKNSFLMVAKSFYYEPYCGPETIYSHIDKVLFQKVIGNN
ncbi:Gly-Xaa carboxypeptidase [Trifolium repens]|nr:Gly-Xaa carboxypeptidase [Trifolium repens]